MAEWRPVSVFGYANKYMVSDQGEVRGPSGRVLKPMRTGTKRPGAQRSKVRLSAKPRVDADVAVLVLEAFVCARPEGHVVMHRNDDSEDNRLCNLSWGTPKENAVDTAMKKRYANQRLSQADVMEIRQLRRAGVSGAALAMAFSVSQQRICDVFKGRTALIGTAK